MSDKPSANWFFAYQLLPKILTGEPTGNDPRLGSTAEATEVLSGMWRAAIAFGGRGHPIHPVAGRVRVDGVDGLLVRMPPAMQPLDAHWGLSVSVGGRWRYLTLEISGSGEGLVLGEWDGEGRHHNLGHHDAGTDLDAFVALCARVLGTPIEVVEEPATVVLRGTLPAKTPLGLPWWVFSLGAVAIGITLLILIELFL